MSEEVWVDQWVSVAPCRGYILVFNKGMASERFELARIAAVCRNYRADDDAGPSESAGDYWVTLLTPSLGSDAYNHKLLCAFSEDAHVVHGGALKVSWLRFVAFMLKPWRSHRERHEVKSKRSK